MADPPLARIGAGDANDKDPLGRKTLGMLDLIGLAGGDGFTNDIQQARRTQPGGNMRTGRKLAEGTLRRAVLKQHAGIPVEDEDGRIEDGKSRPDTGNDVFAGHFRLIRFRAHVFVLRRRRPFPNGENGDDGAEPQDCRHIGRVKLRDRHDGKHADNQNRQPVSAKLFPKSLNPLSPSMTAISAHFPLPPDSASKPHRPAS